MDEPTVELIDYLRVIWRQKWIILITFAAAIVAAWSAGQAITPSYRTQTSLLLLPPLSSELDAEPVGSRLAPEAYETLAVSTTLLATVIERAGLPDNVTVEDLKNRFSVSVKRLSSGGEFLLTASIRNSNPQRLSEIAHAWTISFTDSYAELFQDRTARSFTYVSENFASTESALEALIEARTAFLAEYAIDVWKAETEALRSLLTSSHQRLLEAQQEAGIVEAYLAARGDEPVEALSTYVLTSDIAPNTLAGALAFGLTAEQYRMILDTEILELETAIAQISEDLAVKQQRIENAEASLQAMDRRIGLLESSYAYLSNKLQEAKIALAESPDPIRIIDAPLVSSPIAPKKTTSIAIAGFLGLMVGTLLAFLVDYLARVHEQERPAHPLEGRPSEPLRGQASDQKAQAQGGENGDDSPKRS